MSTALKLTVATLATVAVLSNTTEAYRPAHPPAEPTLTANNSLAELKKAHRARLAAQDNTPHTLDRHHHGHHGHHNQTRPDFHPSSANQHIAVSEEYHWDQLPIKRDWILYDEDEEQGSGGINIGSGGWSGNVSTNGGFNANVSGGWNGGRPTVGGGWSGSVGSGTGSIGIKNGPGGTSYGAGWTGTVGGGQFGANIGGGRGGLSGGVSWTKTFDEELDEVADALQGFGGFSGCICNNPRGCPC